MKFEKTEVWGFEHAIRGMRNSWESWDKSDSIFHYVVAKDTNGRMFYKDAIPAEIADCCKLGKKDLDLMQKLIKAGSEHRKFLRQIFVAVDITAPLYWWKEADTYKVGTVSNSTSTMHKLASTPITMNCFEMDDFENICVKRIKQQFYDTDIYIHSVFGEDFWSLLIKYLEELRQKYNETKDKRYWKELSRLLPESWLQKRTITMNYENLLNMYRQRKNHKLTEWSKSFCDWVKNLPYAEELICVE